MALRVNLAVFPRLRQGFQSHVVVIGQLPVDRAHLLFFRIACQSLFARAQLGQHRAVGHLRDRVFAMLGRQPQHRDQISDQDDDVLRDLGPGNRAHAAQKRADQDAGQAEENAD